MKMKLWALSAILAVAFLIAAPAFAHHGTAGEDTTKVVTVKGTVTDFQFINPHTQIYVDVKDEQGNVQNWNGELSNALVLHRAGWTSKIVKAGDVVTLNGYRGKKNAAFLRLTSVTLSDGREMEAFPRLE
jgi:Family of unknown function (DUF6152)